MINRVTIIILLFVLVSCNDDGDPDLLFFRNSNAEVVSFDALVDGVPFNATFNAGQNEVSWEQGTVFAMTITNASDFVFRFEDVPDIIGTHESSGNIAGPTFSVSGGCIYYYPLGTTQLSHSSCLVRPAQSTIVIEENTGSSLRGNFVGILVKTTDDPRIEVEGSFEIALLD